MIPFVRPDFSAYVADGAGATSLGDWLDNYQVSGSPSNPDRLYAGVRSVVDNDGANVFMNPFGGFIESGTMALHEMTVGCRVNGVMWQQIGVAAIRDSANAVPRYGHALDSVLRLGVEFYSAGPDSKDKKFLGWDGVTSIAKFMPPVDKGGFRKYGPGAYFSPSTISTVGGIQYESFYQIKFEAGLQGGKWWVIHNGNFIGYYPTTLFDEAPPPNLVATKACEFDVYGEVYAPKPAPWPKTPMGSGHFAAEKSPNAAGFRDITYIPAVGASPVGPPPNVTLDVPGTNDACYTKTPLVLGPAPWNWFFYADGPGGAAPGCTGPLP
jgi:Neprosin